MTLTDDTSGSATAAVTYTFHFSEAVTDFDVSKVTLGAGATAGMFTKLSSTDYTLKVNTSPVATGSYMVSVATGAFHDVAGNVNIATNPTDTQGYLPQPVISLGAGLGQLIMPITVSGSNYYFWDKNGDGVASALDGTTAYIDAGLASTLGSNTAGLSLVIASLNGSFTLGTYPTYPPGTAVNTASQINTTYGGLLSIWDALNGSSTAGGSAGIPPGWVTDLSYYSSTAYSVNNYYSFNFSGGNVGLDRQGTMNHYIAIQVL
jgi:hypothetical protein